MVDLTTARERLALQVERGIWQVPEAEYDATLAAIAACATLAEVEGVRRLMLAAGW